MDDELIKSFPLNNNKFLMKVRIIGESTDIGYINFSCLCNLQINVNTK